MLLGLQEPDAGTVAVFGGTPARAIHDGRIGAMLQGGGVLRDLTVRELVEMMASLFPAPLDVDAAIAHAQLSKLADRRTERLSGGETQRFVSQSRLSATPTSSCWTSQPWAWTSNLAVPSGRH
jgi:ABC-2 type transport system ATP-binding protein